MSKIVKEQAMARLVSAEFSELLNEYLENRQLQDDFLVRSDHREDAKIMVGLIAAEIDRRLPVA